MTIPNDLYNREVLSLIEDLVQEGHKSYDSISDDDKEKLTVACMNTFGDDALEFIHEGNYLDLIIAKIKFCVKNPSSGESDISELLRKSALEYHENSLKELFNSWSTTYLSIISGESSEEKRYQQMIWNKERMAA